MITISIKSLLLGILIVALIILVVYVTVLVSNLTDTVKKANAIIDGGTAVAGAAIAKVDEIGENARQSAAKVSETTDAGLQLVQGVLNKVTKK